MANIQYIYRVSSAEIASAIANYRATSAPEAAARFARSTVAMVAPASPTRAKSLLWACARLGAFGISVGLELVPEECLHPSVIERFIVIGTNGCSPAARRTLRTNLRFVATRIERGSCPSPTPLPRERAKSPYGEAEITSYLALADAQPTVARRRRATGLICLGAGAGLMGAALRHVRGTDVTCRSGGVVVTVGGAHPRVVPVLARYQALLIAAASFAGESFVIGGVDPARKNVTTPLISSLAGGVDLPRLSTARLRASWLATCADQLGLKAFMEAAGITCSQRLGDLVSELPVLDETEAVALLGGR